MRIRVDRRDQVVAQPVAQLENLRCVAQPGEIDSAGWLVPIDPLFAAPHAHSGYANVLSLLARRAQ